MRLRLSVIFTVLLSVFTACENTDTGFINLSVVPETSLDIDAQATTLVVDIFSNSTWTVSSDASWCTPDIQGGSDNGQAILTVTANNGTTERVATVVVTAGELSENVVVTQEGATNSVE